VLVVDDNADIRYYLRTCLSDRYEVLEAKDGQEGLTIAQDHIPDLIVCDLVMPILDGWGMLEALRTDSRTDHIPVLMLTARVEDENRLATFAKGADGYLGKPFQREELRVRLARLLESRQQWQTWVQATPAGASAETEVVDPRSQFVSKLENLVRTHLDDEAFDTERLGREMGLSRTQLHRKVKALTGLPPGTYVRQLRMQEARRLLLQSDLNVNEIAFRVGYADPAHFTRMYGQQFGETPTQTRQEVD